MNSIFSTRKNKVVSYYNYIHAIHTADGIQSILQCIRKCLVPRMAVISISDVPVLLTNVRKQMGVASALTFMYAFSSRNVSISTSCIVVHPAHCVVFTVIFKHMCPNALLTFLLL